MRFQSMPDNWDLHYSAQDERNAMIGNAVPPLTEGNIARNRGCVMKCLDIRNHTEFLRASIASFSKQNACHWVSQHIGRDI